SSARRIALGAAAAALATAAFFARAAFTRQIFIERDIQRVYYPLYAYWVERVRRGELPRWYPYDGLGAPYLGMLISGTFHPSKLLYLVFGLGTALKLNLLAGYWAALVGMYLLAREGGRSELAASLAGVAYGFSGFFVSLSNNLLYVVSAATVPWTLWFS